MKSTETHATISDATPNRCTIEFIGSRSECREFLEDHGNDTWSVFPIAEGAAFSEGTARAWHDGRRITALGSKVQVQS